MHHMLRRSSLIFGFKHLGYQPIYLLTDNGMKFFVKFFETVCSFLGIKHFSTNAFHPRTKGHAERYNKVTASRLHHVVANNQRNWEIHIQLLTYAYKIQVHRSTLTPAFSISLTPRPPSGMMFHNATALDMDASNHGAQKYCIELQ